MTQPVVSRPLRRPALLVALILLCLAVVLAGADLLSPARILGWLIIAAGLLSLLSVIVGEVP